MRPTELNPLFVSAVSLTGIGPRLVVLLKKALRLPPGVAEPRVIDLLWHLPTGVIDRRAEPTVADAVPGTIATFAVRVLKHRPSPRGNAKAPYKVQTEDDTGRLDLVFFHAVHSFIERQLPVGEIRFVSGRIERTEACAPVSDLAISVVPALKPTVLSVSVLVAATTESMGSTTLSTSEQMASPAQFGLALVKPRNGSMYCDTEVTLSRNCCMPPCMASICRLGFTPPYITTQRSPAFLP